MKRDETTESRLKNFIASSSDMLNSLDPFPARTSGISNGKQTGRFKLTMNTTFTSLIARLSGNQAESFLTRGTAMFIRQKTISIALFTIFCCLSAITPSAVAQAVKAGYVAKTIFFLPLFVAQKMHHYDAESLKVELIHMGSAGVNLQALVAGHIHFSAMSPDGIIIFNEKGGNLKTIGGIVNGVAYTLVGGKAYKKIEDLKGTRLGVASLKGGGTTFLIEYLRTKGLVYPRDYNLAVIPGGTPARLAALEANSIAAAVLGVPHGDMAVDGGFSDLGNVGDVITAYQFGAINVDPAWAEKNRATVVKFLKAHIRSIRWIYDNPEAAAEFATKEVGVRTPYAQRGIDSFIKSKLYPRDGSVTLDGIKANLEVLEKDGVLRPPLSSSEKYVDLSYVRQAQKQLGM
jgi:ABC-type nitrate/sulfonate/bicarbonate transport system substrate-binding protein